VTDKQSGGYDDIIDLPAPTSERHPRMPRGDRAAQFAPFSALSGYEDAINETARLTMRERICDEQAAEALDRWHRVLSAISDAQPKINLTYFIPDKAKRGGRYITRDARLMRFDECRGVIFLDDGAQIPLETVKSIKSKLLSDMLEEDF